MDVRIRTLDVPFTPALDRYIQEKLARLDRLNARVVDARFELRSERQRTGGEVFVSQFTITTSSAILRAEHRERDLHLSIDGAIDRMASQIMRFRKKQVKSRRRARGLADADGSVPEALPLADEFLAAVEDEEPPVDAVVRRKRFTVYPMTEEEAIEQMELLGHDFFVFFNPSDEQINVLYRRRDGRYGVIQPDLA